MIAADVRECGSVLIEAVVAAVLVAVMAGATVTVSRATASSLAASRARLEAVALAEAEVEAIRALPPDVLQGLVDTAPAGTWVRTRTLERDGRDWQVEARMARSSPFGSVLGCTGADGDDPPLLTGTVTVVPASPSPSSAGRVRVALPLTIAPERVRAVAGAVVVRVDDGAADAAPLAGVTVLVHGPIGAAPTTRTAVTDGDGCVQVDGLATGLHEVTLIADGRIDERDRLAGSAPGAPGGAASAVRFDVGVARGTRPGLRVSLAPAATLRVAALVPDGAVPPDDVDGGGLAALRWWLAGETGSSLARPLDGVTERALFPAPRVVRVGACEEEAPTTSARAEPLAGQATLMLVPLSAVRVVIAVPEQDPGDPPGAGDDPDDGASGDGSSGDSVSGDGATEDPGGDASDGGAGGPVVPPPAPAPVDLVAVVGVDCAGSSVALRWSQVPTDGPIDVAIPAGRHELRLVAADGAVLSEPVIVVVAPDALVEVRLGDPA